MFSKANLQALDEGGYRYIVAAKLKTLKKDKKEEINFNLAVKYKPNFIEEYEKMIIGLRKLGNNRMADAFEQKLKILKDNL